MNNQSSFKYNYLFTHDAPGWRCGLASAEMGLPCVDRHQGPVASSGAWQLVLALSKGDGGHRPCAVVIHGLTQAYWGAGGSQQDFQSKREQALFNLLFKQYLLIY